ncbi:Protein DedA [anaerobic digester metagenome]
MLPGLIELFLHLDKNLPLVIQEYGIVTYVLLFVIIFLETGLVITPFLPGDSLLFVSGAVAAAGHLNLYLLLAVFIAGAILGDTANYWIGNFLGLRVFQRRFPEIIRQEYIDRTYDFFERYGGLAIFIARFVPLVRTFAPFLAGVGTMCYRRFLLYNIVGAVAWAFVLVLAGYFIGAVPVVNENLNLLIYGVMALTAGSLVYILYRVVHGFLSRRAD